VRVNYNRHITNSIEPPSVNTGSNIERKGAAKRPKNDDSDASTEQFK
jgi:hypothetical protein